MIKIDKKMNRFNHYTQAEFTPLTSQDTAEYLD